MGQLAADLIVEEYKSVRAEVLAAVSYSQAIVRWSFASFGVVIAAGLLTARSSAGLDQSWWVAILLFGWFLPGLGWSMALAWLGELVRLERASMYLRLLEKQLAESPEIVSQLGIAPLRFHSTAALRAKQSIIGTQAASQLGIAAGFFGTALASELMFVILVLPIADSAGWMFPWVASISASLQIGGLVWCWSLGWRLLKMNAWPLVSLEDTNRIVPGVPRVESGRSRKKRILEERAAVEQERA